MEFANLLKTNRESTGLTQGRAAEKLGVTEKTISNWETGTILPPTDKLQGIGKAYGIGRESLLGAYDAAIWPQERIPEDFPTCLFVDEILPYVTGLRFTPQEVELIRMLEIYWEGKWEFSSLRGAYELLSRLPYGYVSRIGVSVLPQMMMDISKKLWPTGHKNDYSGSYDGTLQRTVAESVMLPHNGEPVFSFSSFDLPTEKILSIARTICITAPDGGRYARVNDNYSIEAVKMISHGKDHVCIAQTRLNNNGTDYSMEAEWKKALHISEYSCHPEHEIEKNASPWISYGWKRSEGRSVCIASTTEKGYGLLDFYQKHMDLF